MRKVKIVTGEIYHIFNRGVDKRIIFLDREDVDRFFQTMELFNDSKSIGSLYEYLRKNQEDEITPLVEFVAYSLMSNHFHFVIKQVADNGISKFMKKLIGGYTSYFNNKYQRSGVLLQGRFKSIHVNSNEYLLYLSAYVNLNDQQNNFEYAITKNYSSWKEYKDRYENEKTFCTQKELILRQFLNTNEYKEFALQALEEIKNNKLLATGSLKLRDSLEDLDWGFCSIEE